MTFNQQLLLMVLDKLIIGLIVGLAVYFAQKKLEEYKSRQSLQVEIDKERVKHIAEEWEAMNGWDTAVGALITRFTELLLDHKQFLIGDSKIDQFVKPDLAKTVEILSRLKQNPTALEEVKDQCRAELEPLLDDSRSKSQFVNKTIEENRFWLGKDLYEHCKKFQRTLGRICFSFDTNDFEELEKEIRILANLREDVLQTLARLHAGKEPNNTRKKKKR